MTKKTIKKVVPILIGSMAITMAVSAISPTTISEATNMIKYYIPKASSGVLVEHKDPVKYISKDEAKAIAMRKVPKNKSKITQVDTVLTYEDPHYDVKITCILNKNLTKIYTIKVDAVTGKINDVDVEKIINNKEHKEYKIKQEKEKKNQNKKHKKEVVKTEFISKDKAIEIALDKIGRDAKLDEIELERDDNPPIYEIEMYNEDYEYEIEIHAITGALLKFEKED